MDSLKVPLFIDYKERIFTFLAILFIFLCNISYEYYQYQKVSSSKFYYTIAKVLNQSLGTTASLSTREPYKKKNHYVLKLKGKDGFIFWTTSKEDLKDLRERWVEVLLIKSRFKYSFLDFLKGFYSVSYIKGVLPKDLKYKLSNFIKREHKNILTKELYSALYLAAPISKKLRDRLSYLGVSHLVAISGFHLGLIASSIFLIFSFFYKPFQQRFFPYRNRAFDAMLVVAMFILIYTAFLGDIPSLIRAAFMMIFGFFLFFRNIKILSFETLFWVVLLILAIFPKFIFSIGFWLSVAGVFYIYLFLHYFKDLNRFSLFVFLNFWVYLAMIPIVHYIFYNFSFLQLISPIISMLFIIFYPLSIFLHILGFGGVLDDFLINYLTFDLEKLNFQTPLWFLILYILISLIAIYKKKALNLLIFVNLTFFIYQVAKL